MNLYLKIKRSGQMTALKYQIQSNPRDPKIRAIVDRWSLFRRYLYYQKVKIELGVDGRCRQVVVNSGLTVLKIFRVTKVTLKTSWCFLSLSPRLPDYAQRQFSLALCNKLKPKLLHFFKLTRRPDEKIATLKQICESLIWSILATKARRKWGEM